MDIFEEDYNRLQVWVFWKLVSLTVFQTLYTTYSIGLEQWYFSLIWTTYMWKLQTFAGSSIKK